MHWSYERDGAAADSPVSVELLKEWTGITHDAEDSMLELQLEAAIDQIEAVTERFVRAQDMIWRCEGFPRGKLRLPRGPVREIVSLTYLSVAGAREAVPPGDYVVDLFAEYPYLVPAVGKCWPAHLVQPGSIELTVKAGYANADATPGRLKRALALLAGEYFDERRDLTNPDALPGPVKALLGRWLGAVA